MNRFIKLNEQCMDFIENVTRVKWVSNSMGMGEYLKNNIISTLKHVENDTDLICFTEHCISITSIWTKCKHANVFQSALYKFNKF